MHNPGIDLFKSCMELCNIILFTTAEFTLSYARYGKPRNGYDVMQLHARIWKGLLGTMGCRKICLLAMLGGIWNEFQVRSWNIDKAWKSMKLTKTHKNGLKINKIQHSLWATKRPEIRQKTDNSYACYEKQKNDPTCINKKQIGYQNSICNEIKQYLTPYRSQWNFLLLPLVSSIWNTST